MSRIRRRRNLAIGITVLVLPSIFKVSPQPPAHLAFVIILHAILHTRSHHFSLRAALRDILKINLRALGL